MTDLLQLPIDRTVDLNNASYKNPGRVLVRSVRDREGWTAYYWLDGATVRLGPITRGSQGTACVFGVTPGDKPLGVNETIARASGGRLTARQIHDADKFGIFAVAPDGQTRSLVWWNDNDQYVPRSGDEGPPWRLQRGRGVPQKVRGERGVFSKRGVPFPPGYEPGADPRPEPAPTPDDPEEPVTEPSDHESLLDLITEERARFGETMTDMDRVVLINRVVWRAGDGWGLARKPSGRNAPQPRTGIPVSTDLIQHRDTGHAFDALTRTNQPMWGYTETGILDWVAPARPVGEDEPEPEEPPAEPPEPENDEPADPQTPNPEPTPEPPDCVDQVSAARRRDAARLDDIEGRLLREVIEPLQRVGIMGYFSGEVGRLIRHGETIIAEDYRPLLRDMRGQ